MKHLMIGIWLFVAACYPPIEETCADIADKQCTYCACASADACGLSDMSFCVDTLTQRCESQASTLEDPKSAVQDCADALDNWTCEDSRKAAAQDRPATTDSCSYFL